MLKRKNQKIHFKFLSIIISLVEKKTIKKINIIFNTITKKELLSIKYVESYQKKEIKVLNK